MSDRAPESAKAALEVSNDDRSRWLHLRDRIETLVNGIGYLLGEIEVRA